MAPKKPVRRSTRGRPVAESPAATSPATALNATDTNPFVGVVIPDSSFSSSAVPSPGISTRGGTSHTTPATSAGSVASSVTGSKRKRLSVPASKIKIELSNEAANDEEVARQLQADEYDGPPVAKKLNVSHSPIGVSC
jgi:hypothetical protein